MSQTLRLSIATIDYDHVRDFRLGTVRAVGIEPIWLMMGLHEIFARFIANREWDVSEISFASSGTLLVGNGPRIFSAFVAMRARCIGQFCAVGDSFQRYAAELGVISRSNTGFAGKTGLYLARLATKSSPSLPAPELPRRCSKRSAMCARRAKRKQTRSV